MSICCVDDASLPLTPDMSYMALSRNEKSTTANSAVMVSQLSAETESASVTVTRIGTAATVFRTLSFIFI